MAKPKSAAAEKAEVAEEAAELTGEARLARPRADTDEAAYPERPYTEAVTDQQRDALERHGLPVL